MNVDPTADSLQDHRRVVGKRLKSGPWGARKNEKVLVPRILGAAPQIRSEQIWVTTKPYTQP